ncbi:MAG TPA: aminoglycoside phosphotransferase [Nocardioidaceae bacterium]|nr:aminoglycoside phosphotransferase [Nocardioidaceae bacterium]
MTSGYDEHLHEYLGHQRWFAGKGRAFSVTGRRTFPWLSEAEGRPAFRVELVTVTYGDGDTEVYQMPVSYYPEVQEHLAHAFIGTWREEDLGDLMAYDGLHDREATSYLLEALLQERAVEGLQFHCLEETERDLSGPSLLMSAEQSNSSLVFGDDALLKVFRKVAPGRNPDIEIHEALTHAGVDKIAGLYGWVSAAWDEEGAETTGTADLGMLQQFLRTATDGWTMALNSVRDLYAEADLHADEVGGDFAGESHRLGAATAEVHRHLAELLDTRTWSTTEVHDLAAAMHRRLDAALQAVPQLEPHADGLRETFDELTKVDHGIPVQRVHGDLHLGQTLRTVKGWKLIDFEGEPAKPLSERVALDSPLRDVAGMLRSFDYAAANLLTDHPHDRQIAYRCREWAQRNRVAFCEGYAEESPIDPRHETVLMRAYETDKAVYEVLYEARNRPSWLGIPMAAIARLSGTDTDTPLGETADEQA